MFRKPGKGSRPYFEEHEFELFVRQRRVIVRVLDGVLEDALAVEVGGQVDLAALLAPALVAERAAPFVEGLLACKDI